MAFAGSIFARRRRGGGGAGVSIVVPPRRRRPGRLAWIMFLAVTLLPQPGTAIVQTGANESAGGQSDEWSRLNAQVEAALSRGEFDRGADLAAQALALAEAARGPEHPETLTSLNSLAVLYVAQGRHEEAEPLYDRALAGRERVLGREHRDTLETVNNLAVLYAIQGRYAEAEQLGLRGLAERERLLGRDHPDTLESVGDLALLYKDQGRYEEAEAFELRALAGRERVLGREHSDTLTSVNNLALLYYDQGRYAEAEPLYLRALEARERLIGRDHPDTLLLVSNLAVLYDTQGRYPEARTLYVRALESRERVLGPEYPDTLTAVNNLAYLNQAEGRYSEAEPLYVRTLEGHERVLGREHPTTLVIVNNLAYLYDAQGRFAEAESLYVRALEARERLLGRDHPDTLVSLHNLAALYHAQGRFADAEPLFVRAFEAHERTLGSEHPRTLVALGNLARLYDAQGRQAEAEPLYLRAVQAHERTLGAEHPNTLRFLSSLAGLYSGQERFAEAEALYVRVLETRERLLGREHPDTLASVTNLALSYRDQGRDADARPLFERALEARRRVLGGEHPDTAGVAAALASLMLESPDTAASALDPARLAVASVRARRGAASTGAFAQAQRGREEMGGTGRFTLLADALWAAASADGEARGALLPEGFTALQDATVGTTNRAVIQMAVRRLADETAAGLGALVSEREELNARWAANNSRYGAALGGSGPEAEALRRALPAERAEIEARMALIDSAIGRDFPQYFALVRPEALDLASAQALLGPDEAILMVIPTARGTHVVAVSGTRVEWTRSAWTSREIDGAVGQLLGNIRVTMAGGRYSYDRDTAHALYRELVEPGAAILQGKRHVFIVAAGSLTGLPFGILVTEPPQGDNGDPEALRTTRWFADAHALVQIPSIQSLQFLRRYGAGEARAPDLSRQFVGFGDPALQGQAVERGRGGSAGLASVFSGRRTRSGGGLADVGQIQRLNRLPGTAVELRSMRSALGAPRGSLFLAERATERALRTMDLSETRILALATHGLVAGEITGASEPGLVFTPPATATDEEDGFLTASEVTALRLDADWVILSACNTAAGDGSEGAPGLSGLARAFFYAGARNLLASHWPVADDAAPRLTVRTVELMRDRPSLSRAEALQSAMREVREDRAHAGWAHPGIWAPFSLIGDGAR